MNGQPAQSVLFWLCAACFLSCSGNCLAETGASRGKLFSWSSTDNKVLVGEFVSATDMDLLIRKPDGTEIKIPKTRLSTESSWLLDPLREERDAILGKLGQAKYQEVLLPWHVGDMTIKGYLIGLNGDNLGTVIIRKEDGTVLSATIDPQDRDQATQHSVLQIVIQKLQEKEKLRINEAAAKKRENESLPEWHPERNLLWQGLYPKFGALVSIDNPSQRAVTLRLVTGRIVSEVLDRSSFETAKRILKLRMESRLPPEELAANREAEAAREAASVRSEAEIKEFVLTLPRSEQGNATIALLLLR